MSTAVPAISIQNISYPPHSPLSMLIHLIARVIHAILPLACFCWLSRITIQIQACIWPRRWPYWSRVQNNLYFGAIPLANWGHEKKISDLGVRAILSFNKDYELKQMPFSNPVQEKEWKDRSFTYLRLPNEDLKAVPVAELAKAVEFVSREIKNHPVYIHCTAGRHRSAAAVVCCLIAIFKRSMKDALEEVHKCRAQVTLHATQLDCIAKWNKQYGSAP